MSPINNKTEIPSSQVILNRFSNKNTLSIQVISLMSINYLITNYQCYLR